MLLELALGSLAIKAAVASPLTRPLSCAPVSGNKTVESYQFYPENADFDTRRCLMYSSVLWNSTVAAWDPYLNEVVHTFEIPEVSGDPALHASGARVDPLDRLSVTINAGATFDTFGQDISGDNLLVKFDLRDNSLLWQVNLTNVTNGLYGGFQDSESDEAGNTFVLGTFPSSLIKVSADGKSAVPWYLLQPLNSSIAGFAGLVRKDDFLLVDGNSDGQLYRFDIRAAEGTPVHIPVSDSQGSPVERVGQSLDGIHLPPLYAGTVLLAADNSNGTVVLRSSDGKWESAEILGTIPNPFLDQGGFTVTSVQVSESIYVVTEFFGDAVNGTLPGNRTSFPMRDITQEVEGLLKA